MHGGDGRIHKEVSGRQKVKVHGGKISQNPKVVKTN